MHIKKSRYVTYKRAQQHHPQRESRQERVPKQRLAITAKCVLLITVKKGTITN
jgi:hypothetical protein